MANATEALVAADYAIGYELMRGLFRELLKTTALRGLARHAGVNESEVRAFMDGADPGVKLWAAGEALATDFDPPEVELDAVALNLLCAMFPLAERVQVRRELAEAIAPIMATRVVEEVDP